MAILLKYLARTQNCYEQYTFKVQRTDLSYHDLVKQINRSKYIPLLKTLHDTFNFIQTIVHF